MAGHGSGDPRKVVMAAMTANGCIAVGKFVAAYLSGSATMLAEGVHSVADTANQGLLLVGMGLSKRKRDDLYPIGRAKETYFWAFIVALMLFFLGGVYAVYEGVHKLVSGHLEPPGSPIAPIVVLVLSIGAEGWSFVVALREFNAQRGKKPFKEALFGGKDPTIPVILLEDAGAVLGLLLALVAIVVTWLTGAAWVDAAGSIVIGVLLCVIGVTLTRDTRSLLIGEGVTKETREALVTITEGVDGVINVSQLLSLHMGPATVLLMMKVRFKDGLSLNEVEALTNLVEVAIREQFPEMKKIFIEPDSVYDPALDPENAPPAA